MTSPEYDHASPSGSTSPGPAVPSTASRILAFAAILVAGACGGLIGYAVVDLQSGIDGGVAPAIGGLVGAVFAAGGVSVVAVLTLRAMTEWHTIDRNKDRSQPPRSNG